MKHLLLLLFIKSNIYVVLPLWPLTYWPLLHGLPCFFVLPSSFLVETTCLLRALFQASAGALPVALYFPHSCVNPRAPPYITLLQGAFSDHPISSLLPSAKVCSESARCQVLSLFTGSFFTKCFLSIYIRICIVFFFFTYMLHTIYLFIVHLFPSPVVPPLERVIIVGDTLTVRAVPLRKQLNAVRVREAGAVTDVELCCPS